MIAVFVTGMREGRLGQSRENLIYKVSNVCINELNLSKFEAVVHVKQARSRKLLEDYALGFASMDMVDTDQGPIKWGVIELANQNIKKDQIEKIILINVPSEIYSELRQIFIFMFKNSGFKDVKINEKIDFEKLYKSRKIQ